MEYLGPVKRLMEKWVLTSVIICSFAFVLVQDVGSVTQIRVYEPRIYKISYLEPLPLPTLTPASSAAKISHTLIAALLTPTPVSAGKSVLGASTNSIPTSVSNAAEATPIPTPSATPAPSNTPSALSVSSNSSNPSDLEVFLLGKVNEYRTSLGLSAAVSDSNTCNFAKKRVQEITVNFSHDGFKDYPYPSFSKVTENIAQNSDYKQVVEWWINSPVHAENMRADTPFICIETSGDYYAYEGWKP